MQTTKNIGFIGISTVRGGSTWIYEALREHPEVCVSIEKETKFFSDKHKYNWGLNYYLSKFSYTSNEKVQGEFDPGYLSSTGTAKRIHQMYPEVKLIACLRDPADRAYSHFIRHKRQGKNLVKTFEDVIQQKASIYINHGFYAKYLKEYYSFFPKKQLYVTFYQDLETNPVKFIQDLYRFLEVDNSFLPTVINTKINFVGTNKAYCPALNRFLFRSDNFLNSSAFLRKIKELLKRMGIKRFRRQIQITNMKEGLNDSKPQMEKNLRNKLIDIFREDIKELEAMTGKDLTGWKE